MNEQRPFVGISVLIINNGKLLLGKRKGSHGDATWATPGGHLEFKESFEKCAKREVEEETGLAIQNVRLATCSNDIFSENNKHYVTIFMLADYATGEPLVTEPDKCEQWQWFAWDDLPTPLFLPIKNLLNQGFTLKELHVSTTNKKSQKSLSCSS